MNGKRNLRRSLRSPPGYSQLPGYGDETLEEVGNVVTPKCIKSNKERVFNDVALKIRSINNTDRVLLYNRGISPPCLKRNSFVDTIGHIVRDNDHFKTNRIASK